MNLPNNFVFGNSAANEQEKVTIIQNDSSEIFKGITSDISERQTCQEA